MAILYHLGNLLIDMGDIPNALNYFNEMRDIAIKVGTDARVYEAEAGMAICALQQGQLEEARKYIHRIWDYIQAHEFRGIGNPDRFYVNCAETLDALGEADTYRKFLEKVHKSYLEMVGRIKRPEWIQSFNQYNPNVRKLIEMLERLGIE